jgi:adenosylmethionine-8-amino-7-oxononanoate aminotransferase
MDITPSWLAADAAHVWHPYTHASYAPAPLPVVRAEGAYFHTHDGRALLDGISSWWVNTHGHNHPALNQALRTQLDAFAHVMFAGLTHAPGAHLAQGLAAATHNVLPHVFYSDNGSTAVEAALKMAYQACAQRNEKQRTLFVALEGAYHGDTFGAMSVCGPCVFHQAFTDLLFEVRHVPARLEGEDGLEALMEQEGHRVAAVIVEPLLQGACGMRTYHPSVLQGIRTLTQQHGCFMIADEVFTGFGRTGTFFACEQASVWPDIMCLSKGITGGYMPLGATLATPEVYHAFCQPNRMHTLFHGHSYTGNPLACALGVENLDIFKRENTLAKVQDITQVYLAHVKKLQSLPCVKEVRVIGDVLAVEMHAEDEGYLSTVGASVRNAFLARNIWIRPLGNVVYFMPPYAVSLQDVHRVCETFHEVLGGVRF